MIFSLFFFLLVYCIQIASLTKYVCLLQSGKASLGEELYKVLTSELSSGEEMLKSLQLKSEHKVLEVINKLEAAIFSWKERMREQVSGKSPLRTSWSFTKDLTSDVDKMELLLDRAETLVQLLKTRYPNLPQTFLDATKIQYGKVCYMLNDMMHSNNTLIE